MLKHDPRPSRTPPPPIVKFPHLLSPVGNDLENACAGLDLLATAVLLLDRGFAIVYANAAAENLFELSKKQIAGRRPREMRRAPEAGPPS